MNNDKLNIQVERNLEGQGLEKRGDIQGAIRLYEANVSEKFNGSHPYDRLAIIYHKQNHIEEEIRVLKIAIDVFTNDVTSLRGDRLVKLEKYQKRLSKLL